jgi:hypothetical protein
VVAKQQPVPCENGYHYPQGTIYSIPISKIQTEKLPVLLHSPNPYRLWFLIGLSSWMKDLSQRNGLD